MTAARIGDLTRSHAQYLIEAVGPVASATLDEDEAGYGQIVLLMPEAGIHRLQGLSEDDDGHLDEYAQVWIGGAVAGRVIGYRA